MYVSILEIELPKWRSNLTEEEINAIVPHIKAISIDSTGLKCYGQDECALEKYGRTRQKREWRKLHISVDHHHIIQTSEFTNRKVHEMHKFS